MQDFQPYIKYILYLITIIGFLWINKIFIKDPELRKWLMQSFEDDATKRASGRSLSAFACTSALLMGWGIAIHYGENHTAPEYFFWGLLSLIGGLYGIKEVGKVMTTKYTGANGNGNGNGHGNGAEPAPQPKLEDASLKKKWEEAETDLSFEEWVKTKK